MRPILIFSLLLTAAGYSQERPANLPVQAIGANDLLALSVYDAPELTRTIRVNNQGSITLPLLNQRIDAAGLLPSELEQRIAEALEREQILVKPVVQVTIAEYHSRPISVMGAVKKPITFQAHSPVTLLEALARAEGLGDFAAAEILVSIPGKPEPMRVPVRGLIDAADPALNVKLTGGEEIRVPEAVKIYVAGNIRKPGAVAVRDSQELTVLKLVALAEGLTPFASKQAYIYRKTNEPPGKREIVVELDQILKRKASDVPLEPHDVLYIPDNSKKRAGMTVLDRIVLFGSTAGATALVWRR